MSVREGRLSHVVFSVGPLQETEKRESRPMFTNMACGELMVLCLPAFGYSRC